MTESPTRDLAGIVAKLSFDDLPVQVVEIAKRVLFDSVGCALGGHVIPRSRIITEFVRDSGAGGRASIIGGIRTSYAQAAFANGELINALDYDAIGPLTNHTVPYVLPSCLAMAEAADASGKDLITAIAVALEVGGRVGSSLMGRRILKDDPPFYEDAPRYSFTSTIFGGVAGGCKVAGLDEEMIANAFGIAGASTPVPAGQKWQRIEGPVIMAKYNCWTGWIAQLATTATLLAQRGFTGDRTILDGEWGFWKFYGSDFFKPEKLLGGLGTEWHLDRITFKAYPIVGANRLPVELIYQLVAQHRINPEDIEQITVKGDSIMLEPNRAQTEVTSAQDAQFCNAYIYALAPFYGNKPGAYWQLPETFEDPRIKALMSKVKIGVHPDASEIAVDRVKSGKPPFFDNTIVELTVRGKTYTAEGREAKGSLARPLDDDDLKEKFNNNASYSSLSEARISRITEEMNNLENVAHIRDLTGLLTTG